MSLQIIKETGVKYDPVFLKILEDIPGGVTIKTNRFPTTTKEIKKGALLNADASSAGLYNIIKSVRLTAAFPTGDTAVAVESPHLFLVGEYLKLNGTAQTITRVSATGIVVPTTGQAGAAIASGSILGEAANPTGAVLYAASAVSRNTIKVRETGVETLLDNVFSGAIVRGTVDESELPYFVTDADKTALTARIRFA